MNKILQFFKSLSSTQLLVISLSALGTLLILGTAIWYTSHSRMSILYGSLTLEDSGKVVQALEARKIPYALEANGSVIRVPEDLLLNTRVTMAREGLPAHNSSIGYEIFDKDESLGTTSFQQNIKMLRALEGELSRTISSFEHIEKARVHLVIPQRELFSKDRQQPRASIVLKILPNHALSKAEINTIGHLVVSAVAGLEVKNITITDTQGNALLLGGSEESNGFGIGSNQEYRIACENRLKRVVEDLLERSLGTGKIKAHIHLEMNFDRAVVSSETYDPSSSVIRSSHNSETREQTPMQHGAEADISVLNNLPGLASEDSAKSTTATKSKTDEIINYEVSKTTQNYISAAGTVQKLSVAVLVDGTYTIDQVTKQVSYQPRSPEELRDIEDLVKVAVGFNEGRQDSIQVTNMPFADNTVSLADEQHTTLTSGLITLIKSLIFGGVILGGLVIIQRIVFKIYNTRGYNRLLNRGEVPINPSTSDIDGGQGLIKDQEQLRQTQVFKDISKVARENPEEILPILRKWLKE